MENEHNLPEEESDPTEEPRERFRRLTSEEEIPEDDLALSGEEGQHLPDGDRSASSERHPTGAPDQTAGWYGQIESEPQEPEPAHADRHPTGDPDQTGGWYGQSDEDETKVIWRDGE